MTKKQTEERIVALEKEISELKSLVLSLALRPMIVPNPLPAPVPSPAPVSPWSDRYPYIGDPIPGTPTYPTITWGDTNESELSKEFCGASRNQWLTPSTF